LLAERNCKPLAVRAIDLSIDALVVQAVDAWHLNIIHFAAHPSGPSRGRRKRQRLLAGVQRDHDVHLWVPKVMPDVDNLEPCSIGYGRRRTTSAATLLSATLGVQVFMPGAISRSSSFDYRTSQRRAPSSSLVRTVCRPTQMGRRSIRSRRHAQCERRSGSFPARQRRTRHHQVEEQASSRWGVRFGTPAKSSAAQKRLE
jgi:hypothetical protein